MNTKVIIGSIVIIAGLLIGSVLWKNPTPQPSSQSPDRQVNTTGQTRYLPYSDSEFARKKDKKRVLYFHAPWCPICRPTDKELTEKMDQIPADVVVFKTDYDTSSELKKKYAITYQHTFVLVDANGNELQKWNGGSLSEIIQKTQYP